MNLFDLIIVQPIFNLLMLIYSWAGDFGVSLVIFTIIIRCVLWPLIKKQLSQSKKMRTLQPEMKKLRNKTKKDKQLYGFATMELYKKNGISPFRSILMALIQLPIYLGIYRVVQIFTVENSKLNEEISKWAYSFIENLPSVKPIIDNPENFNSTLFNLIELITHAVNANGINILIILMIVVAGFLQFIISKQSSPQETDRRIRDILTEAANGVEPDQAEINAAVMQKMIKIMPIFIAIIMLNFPAALVLYYFITNIITVIQQWYILRQKDDEVIPLNEEDMKRLRQKADQLKATREMYANRLNVANNQNSTEKNYKVEKSEPEVVRITAKTTSKKGKKNG